MECSTSRKKGRVSSPTLHPDQDTSCPSSSSSSISKIRRTSRGVSTWLSLPRLLLYTVFLMATTVLVILWHKVGPVDDLLVSGRSRWLTTPPMMMMEEPQQPPSVRYQVLSAHATNANQGLNGQQMAPSAVDVQYHQPQQHEPGLPPPPPSSKGYEAKQQQQKGEAEEEEEEEEEEKKKKKKKKADDHEGLQPSLITPSIQVLEVQGPRTGRAAELEALYRDYHAMSTRTDSLQSRIQSLGKRVKPSMLRGGANPIVDEIKYLQGQVVTRFKGIMDLEKKIKAFKLQDGGEAELDTVMLPWHPTEAPATNSDITAKVVIPPSPPKLESGGHTTQIPASGGATAITVPAGHLSSDHNNHSSTSYPSVSDLVTADFFEARREARKHHPGQLPDLGPTATVVKVRDGECQTADCRLLVTGCGRSGTHFVANLLETNGYNVTHERIGTQGSVSWVYGAPYTRTTASEEAFFSAKEDMEIRQRANFSFFPIVHLTRHPLPLIASLTTCFCGCGSLRCGRWADTPSWRFAGRFIKYSEEFCRIHDKKGTCIDYTSQLGRLKRAMEYYIGWNLLIEKQAHYRVQMEALNVKELLAVTLDEDGEKDVMVARDFTSTSKARKAPITWDALRAIDPAMAKTIAEMASRYGYVQEPLPIHVT